MLRRSSVVHVVDELARAQRRDRAQVELERMVLGLLWAVWSVRVELGLLLMLAAVQRAVASTLGDIVGLVVVVLVMGAAIAVRPARGALLRVLHAMNVRRSWARATIDSGVAAGPFR